MLVPSEGTVLWEPGGAAAEASRMRGYMRWLAEKKALAFPDYEGLWRWSVTDLEAFWASIWEYFGVRATRPYTRVLSERRMPGARWFEGAELSYAEHALLRRDDATAVVYCHEDGTRRELSFAELADQVARARAGLVRLGVVKGDRVVAFMPNAPETLIAFLAAASLGATWSSCSPEFGVKSVLDRFSQIAPKVLLAVDGYRHGGKAFDRSDELAQIRAGLPTLAGTVVLARPEGGGRTRGADVTTWDELVREPAPLAFEPLPFDHPLWILYSSGTTGLPKPIVQGQGGILLEHLKALALHCDLGPDDRFFWFSTTGWMMWNFLIGGLLVGATVLLYEGSPAHPDLDSLWAFAAAERMTYFGTSAPYLVACLKGGIEPGARFDLSRLRGLGSTGAPLPVEGFAWVYQKVSQGLLLGSVSGGTDVCTAFVLSCPLLPVRAGEIQCRGLGCKVEAFDAAGQPVLGEVGELAITLPMPSMPLYFWNDDGGRRYEESYFASWPGVWCHGDWIKITRSGGSVIYGRSDSTLNRGGVRMGTSEFYRVVEAMPEVADSLVIDTGSLGREDELWLFVVPAPGVTLDAALEKRIRGVLRSELSPRHVPDHLRAIAEVPRTLNGKKMEVPVKRLLAGVALEKAVNPGTLASPRAIEPFVALAAERGRR